MTVEVEITETPEGETPAAVVGEASAVAALAEVAASAIEGNADHVAALVEARAELQRAYEQNAALRDEFAARFTELEARIADAQFTAAATVEAAEEILDEVDETTEEIEDEIEDEIEATDIPVVLDGETVVEVAPLIEVENPPALHQEALSQTARKKRFFTSI